MSELIKAVVSAIIIHEAQKRKPPDIAISFFGEHDLWFYNAVMDDKTCQACKELDEVGKFKGAHLRRYFPYLEIETDTRIKANVHPNCRC